MVWQPHQETSVEALCWGYPSLRCMSYEVVPNRFACTSCQ
jgi:hypothetical protein